MQESLLKKTASVILLSILVVLTVLIFKPIFISIIIALILAFIFAPVYDFLYKHTNSKNLSASILVVVLFALILLPIWFLTPILLDQSFSIFQATQQIDFVKPLKSLFPSFFASEQFSAEIGSIFSSFTSKVANSIVNSIGDVILNFPTLALQLTVVFFTFFFVLRDKEIIVDYIKSILPFSKDVEKKLFDHSKNITSAVLYGQIVVGIIQGIIAGMGFFVFGVENALFLTILAILGGILPIIGTPIIWVPVMIYLFVASNNVAAWGVFVFGMISSTVEHLLRPIIVSMRTKIHTGILIISTIGGIFFFGIMGFILGPLIVSYLLVLLEIYRGKPIIGVIVENSKK